MVTLEFQKRKLICFELPNKRVDLIKQVGREVFFLIYCMKNENGDFFFPKKLSEHGRLLVSLEY